MTHNNHHNATRYVATADVVAFAYQDEIRHVLLVTRGKEPYKGSLVLPGGRVKSGEDSRAAAARELAEETGMAVPAPLLQFLGRWDTPGRDPRGDYHSDVYTVVLPATSPPTPGSDAAAVEWVPESTVSVTPLGFADHNDMVAAAAEHWAGR